MLLCIAIYAQPHGGKVERIYFSDDGKMLATYTDDDCKTKIWDTETGDLIRTIKGYRSNIWFTKGVFMLVMYSEGISLRIDPSNVFTQDTIKTSYRYTSNYYILKDYLMVREDLRDSKGKPLDYSYSIYDKGTSEFLHRFTIPKSAKKGQTININQEASFSNHFNVFLFNNLNKKQIYFFDFENGFEPIVYNDKSNLPKVIVGKPFLLFVNDLGECKDMRTGNVITMVDKITGSSWDSYVVIENEKVLMNYTWVDKLIKKYSIPNFEVTGVIEPSKENKRISSVTFSPNGEKYAVLDNVNMSLKIFETQNGQLVSTLNDSAAIHDMKNYEAKIKYIKEWEEEEKLRKQQQLENAYPKYVPSYWQFISEAPSVKFYGTIKEVEDNRNKQLVSVMVHNQEDKPITVQFKIRIFIKEGNYLHITDHDAEISLRPKEAATNRSTMIHVNARRSDIQKVTIEGY
jgi:WD40 repeat protein